MRFISIENNDGTIKALRQEDDYQSVLFNEDVACWVWQEASSAEEAVANHVSKHREYEEDNSAGRPIKDTY